MGLVFLQFRNPFQDINTSCYNPFFQMSLSKKGDRERMRRAFGAVGGIEKWAI